MRILVVDDSEDWRDLTEAALLAAGYEEVLSVDSAHQAFAVLGLTADQPRSPAAVDLALLDLMMPEIDGIEACARIRKDPGYADVPIIMVTAAKDMDSLSNAFVAGATDYITKPFNRIELLARVRSALKLKAELDRRRAREAELLKLTRTTIGGADTSRWIDDATGLLHGSAAEAYLNASTETAEAVSVFALMLDRLDALLASRGPAARRAVLADVARAVRDTAALVGVIPAAYRDGLIVLVAPDVEEKRAKSLAESLRSAVRSLALANPEAIAADRITASIGVVTAPSSGRTSRAELVATARAVARQAATAGGDRIIAFHVC